MTIRRFLLASFVLLLPLAALACGDDPNAVTDATAPPPRTTPLPDPNSLGAKVPGTCTGSGIAGIQRDNVRRYEAPPERVIDPEKTYIATMNTSKGTITLELAAKDAPNTTNNFVFLSCHGYYDTLVFHRVVKQPQPFVIQGGDPQGNGSGGPGYRFADEFSPTLRHTTGVISMANSGPNTNGSQFFITLAPAPHLNDMHSVFGKVTAGMEVVNAIAAGDVIHSVSIEER